MDKLVEHYGIVISESTVRHITHLHAQKMHQKTKGGPVHAHDSQEIAYAATLLGDVDEAGKQLRACAKRVGFGAGHRVHGVGDGAQWIAHQMK
jgi:hypothetical protein